MVTPFDARGRLDEDGFVTLLHYLLEHGSDGVVVAATTGEAPTLSDDEGSGSGSSRWRRRVMPS